MRFLFEWHAVAPSRQLAGAEGLLQIVRRLDGFELAAGAWEKQVLPARMDRYDPSFLDLLCLTGQVGWARVSESGGQSRLNRATPLALFLRDHGTTWKQLAIADDAERDALPLSLPARAILDALRERGASFAHELAVRCALDADAVQQGLAELVSAGLVSSDGFAGLRALIADHDAAIRARPDGGTLGAERRGRSARPRSTPRSRFRRERCSSATASSAAGSSRAKRMRSRGVSSRASIAGSRPAARFAAAAS